MATLTPYPWANLPRVSRAEAEATTRARLLLEGAIDTAQLSYAASQLLSTPVEISLRGASLSAWLPMTSGLRLHLATEVLGAEITLDLDPALATRIAAKVIGEPITWIDPLRAPPPEIVGAVSAFAVALARRSGDGSPWRLIPAARAEASAHLVVRARVMVGEDVHEAQAAVPVAGRVPRARSFDRTALVQLGDLPLTLRAVGAAVRMKRSELDALEPGDAVLPGDAWTFRSTETGIEGTLALVAPRGEIGLSAALAKADKLGATSSLVLIAGAARTPWDNDMQDPMTTQNDDPTAETLGDVEIVVRVEVATLTLPARAWAELSAGDVIATGVRVGDVVTLRAGGVAVARGELCDLEGQLAVRIVERTGGAS